jgi:hypothetical protein
LASFQKIAASPLTHCLIGKIQPELPLKGAKMEQRSQDRSPNSEVEREARTPQREKSGQMMSIRDTRLEIYEPRGSCSFGTS